MKRRDSLNIGKPCHSPGVMILSKQMRRWFEKYEDIFAYLWVGISGASMTEVFERSALTLSEDPGVNYIPADYAGTITAPDEAGLFTADTDNLWGVSGAPVALSVGDLNGQDYNRTLVHYDDVEPFHVRAIGILTDGVVLSNAEMDMLSRDLDLWLFFFGILNDYGRLKDNRQIP